MLYRKVLSIFIILGALLGVIANTANAQGVNYIDESGNIMFADSIEQVPAKFRPQLIKPTPGPRDKKEYKKQMEEYKKRMVEEEKEKKAAEKLAEKERRQKEKEQQRQAKKLKKETSAQARLRYREQEQLAAEAKSKSGDE